MEGREELQWWAVTCGRGMERFAALEVTDKLQPLSVRPTDGKLHFLLRHDRAAAPAPSALTPASTPSSSSSPPPPSDATAAPTPPPPSASAPASGPAATDLMTEERLRGLKTAERLFVQVLAHFEGQGHEGRTSGQGGGEDRRAVPPGGIKGGLQHGTTGSNPFRIYEHGGLFVMVGWAVNYAHLWEQAVRALRRVEGVDGDTPVSFRVSAKVRGSWSRLHTAQEVARLFGTQIKNKLGWRIDLKNYNTEVMIHLNDEQLVIALPVGRVPISKRAYMASFGLRPPVAWAMARLAEIGEGEVVCDPMCGAGTLLIEAAQEWPNACYLGMDVSEEQLGVSRDNLQQSQTHSRIALLRSQVHALPLRSEAVDVVLCDLPFGRKFQVGDAADLVRLYHAFAVETLRVLRPRGRAVMLTSQSDSLDAALHAASDRGYRWAIKERHYVKLGALDARIHYAIKEPTPVGDDGAAKRTANAHQHLAVKRKKAEEIRDKEEEQKKKKAKVDDDGSEGEEEESSDDKIGEMASKAEDKEERRNRIFSALYFHRK